MKIANLKYQNFLPVTTFGNAWKAVVILMVGIILTLGATIYMKNYVDKEANRDFKLICADLKTIIEARLRAHAQILRSGSALFAVSDTVERSEWKEFYERLRIRKNLPGIQGFGYSVIIPKNKLQQHIQNIRNEGFSEYTVKPSGDRVFYTSIIYLEPFSDRNLRAFGYDMFSEPIRRKAMELARDSNLTTLSNKVILVQETDKDVQAGTLMYVPVYRNGMPINTVEQRRAAIRGWVYSPYRMNDLMQGIFGRWGEKQNGRIHLQVYDDSMSFKSLLFDSQRKETLNHHDNLNLTVSLPIEFNSKKWILYFTQSDRQNPLFQGRVFIVFIGGLIISLLLFSLSLSLFNTRYRASYIANQLTSELKKSESRFKTLLHTSRDGIHIIDNQGFIVEANHSFCSMLGYTREELLQLNVSDWDKQMPREELIAHIGELMTSPAVFETRHCRKDGTFYDVEISCVGVMLEGCNYLYTSARDITDRKRAEEALLESEARFRDMADTAPVLIWLSDTNSLTTYVSKPWINFTGRTVEQELGKAWEEGVHPADYQNCIDIYNGAFKTQCAYKMEYRLRRADGEYCWFLEHGVPRFTPDGVFVGYIGSCVDITERKQAEKAIKESEAKFRTLFEAADDAIFILNGNIFIDCNPKTEILFKCTKEDIIGHTVQELSPSKQPDGQSSSLKAEGKIQAALNGEPQFFEWIHLRPNGTTFETEVSLNKMEHSGFAFVQAIVRDITERKLVETEIIKLNETLEERVAERTRALKSINNELAFHIKEIEQFTYIASHDLQEPLNTLTNFTKLIQEEYAGKLDDDGNKSIAYIYNSASRMKVLLKGILDYSLLGKERELTMVDCNKIVDGVLADMPDSINASGANIIVQQLPTINGYATELRLLFHNLINNAIKFRKKDIHPEIKISAENLDKEWKFAIEDNGIGIKYQDREKVFIIFKRMNNRSEYEGTGIGLAHCKKIVELHHGKIWLESTPGRGSVFFFTILKH